MIQQNWIDLAVKHAGKETPEVFDDLVHNNSAFKTKDIKINFSGCAFLNPPSEPTQAPTTIDPIMSFEIARSNRPVKAAIFSERITSLKLVFPDFWDLTKAFLNLSYLNALYQHYKQPRCALSAVAKDCQTGLRVAEELFHEINDRCGYLCDTFSTDRNIEAVLQAIVDNFKQISPGAIVEHTAICCFLKRLAMEMVLSCRDIQSANIPSFLSEHLSSITKIGTKIETQAFKKVTDSLEGRKGGDAISKQRNDRIENLCGIISSCYIRPDSPEIVTLTKAQWEGARTKSNNGIPMTDHQTRKKDQREVEEKLGVTIKIVKK